MRVAVGMLIAGIAAAIYPSLAQYPPRGPYPQQEECPQGRQLRQQKYFPPQMTDCQVLDADTAEQNRRLHQGANPAPPRPAPAHPVAAMPSASPPALATPPSAPGAAPTPIQPPSPPEPARLTDYDGRIVGDWMTSANIDRFGDGGTFVAATINDGLVLAVRCIQKTLTLGIAELGFDPKPLKVGDRYYFKFRVDQQPIVELEGTVINERLIQIYQTPKAFVVAMRDGRETAMRIETPNSTTKTTVFQTKGGQRAFVDLSRECPLD